MRKIFQQSKPILDDQCEREQRGVLIGFGTIVSTAGFNKDKAGHLKRGDKVALVIHNNGRKKHSVVRSYGVTHCWGDIGYHYQVDSLLSSFKMDKSGEYVVSK